MKRLHSRNSPPPLASLAARRKHGRYGQGGMALMEALVAILIFSFGILGLIGLEASAINFSADSEDRNRAALFANDVTSSMWLAGTVTVPAGQLATWQASIADPTTSGLSNGTLAIAAVAGIANAADITITWQAPNHSNSNSSQLVTRVILP
jgi:type IV pilus assembly protein PilV